jgi:hypothetical protein
MRRYPPEHCSRVSGSTLPVSFEDVPCRFVQRVHAAAELRLYRCSLRRRGIGQAPRPPGRKSPEVSASAGSFRRRSCQGRRSLTCAGALSADAVGDGTGGSSGAGTRTAFAMTMHPITCDVAWYPVQHGIRYSLAACQCAATTGANDGVSDCVGSCRRGRDSVVRRRTTTTKTRQHSACAANAERIGVGIGSAAT